MELANFDKRGSIYLLACSTPSFPLEDRQTGRQTALLPACQTLSPLTPTLGSQVCVYLGTVSRASSPQSTVRPAAFSSPVWISVLSFLGDRDPPPLPAPQGVPFVIETWVQQNPKRDLPPGGVGDRGGELGKLQTPVFFARWAVMNEALGGRWERLKPRSPLLRREMRKLKRGRR